MYITYLLLGSNLGDRVKYLDDASRLIDTGVGTIRTKSSLYNTASWGRHDQPDFINMVIEVLTESGAEDLLKLILAIELRLGRKRKERWGSRTIDIDILFFGDQIIDLPDLKVPHPCLHERRFALEPLCEIAPSFIHPILNKSVSQLLHDLSDSLLVKKLS